MEEIFLNATLKEKTSQKTGNTYVVVEVELTPNCKKDVFLEPSEVELIRLFHAIRKSKTN